MSLGISLIRFFIEVSRLCFLLGVEFQYFYTCLVGWVGGLIKWYYNLLKTEPNTEVLVGAGTKLGNIKMKFVMIGLMLQNVCLFVICPSCLLMLVKYCAFLFEVKRSFGQ